MASNPQTLTAERAGESPNVALGYLRACIVVLVIAHHVATAYAPIGPATHRAFTGVPMLWGAFPVMSAQTAGGFLVFLSINDTFFMSLLFLLSGLYVAASLARRGVTGFVGGRVLRLGVPFVLGVLVLAPLAYFPAYLQITGRADLAGFVRAWMSLGSLPSGPTWFIGLLLGFDLIAAFLFAGWPGWAKAFGRSLPDGARQPVLLFGVLLLLSAAAYIPMAADFGSQHWTQWGAISFQTSRIIHYGVYFLLGVVVGAQGLESGLASLSGGLRRGWWVWIIAALLSLVLGTVLVIGLTLAKGLEAPAREAIGGISFVLICGTLCFAWMATFLRFVRRPNPVMDSLQANSYGIFLVHYVFVNWLNYALLGPELPAIAKFALAFGGALALSWITAAILRRLPGIGRAVSGPRTIRPASSEATPVLAQRQA